MQTYARVGLPRSRIRTRWRFGSKRRLVATIEWLRLLPKLGFFPQIAQTLDMERQGSRSAASRPYFADEPQSNLHDERNDSRFERHQKPPELQPVRLVVRLELDRENAVNGRVVCDLAEVGHVASLPFSADES